MTDIDKLWGELGAKRPILICRGCGSHLVRFWIDANPYGKHYKCEGCGRWTEKAIEAVTLTRPELGALVERGRKEAVKDALKEYRCAGCGETSLTIEDLYAGYHARAEGDPNDGEPTWIQCGPISKPQIVREAQ